MTEVIPEAEIAARLMRSSHANFFYDQVFIKEPGLAAGVATMRAGE